MSAPTDIKTMMAQAGTIMYFAFFLLMPIYTKLEATKPPASNLLQQQEKFFAFAGPA